MADFFHLHDSNPNDTIGGGGCLATGRKAGEDCSGNWFNFHRVSTEFDESPYAVICQHHLELALEQGDFEEVLTGGDVLPLRETQRTVVEG